MFFHCCYVCLYSLSVPCCGRSLREFMRLALRVCGLLHFMLGLSLSMICGIQVGRSVFRQHCEDKGVLPLPIICKRSHHGSELILSNYAIGASPVCVCLILFVPLCLCLILFLPLCLCLTLFVPLCLCLILFVPPCLCLTLFVHLCLCLTLSVPLTRNLVQVIFNCRNSMHICAKQRASTNCIQLSESICMRFQESIACDFRNRLHVISGIDCM